MFKLSQKYNVNRSILKCDFLRYSPSETSTINSPNSQIYINNARADSVNGLKGAF